MSENHIANPENSSLLTEDVRIQEALLVWLMNYNSCQTRRAYLYAPEQLKSFVFDRADISLLDVEQKHVIAWKEWLVGEELSQSTINQKLSAVSSFYKNLMTKGLVAENPADGVKRYSVNPYGKDTFLTLAQQKHLLAQVDRETEQGRRDYAMLLFFLTTGVACECRDQCLCESHRMDGQRNRAELHEQRKCRRAGTYHGYLVGAEQLSDGA